ncbi:hypothetical protein ABW20_dc0101035 [Dactylellina cionopaga]|nr:hypothetical protein ABW20_dc0101035 [Dactylellina cionopaga]
MPPKTTFNIQNMKFNFIGRTAFAGLVATTYNLIDGSGGNAEHHHIDGSLGWGKSHILAALVCVLLKNRIKVIYLPHYSDYIHVGIDYLKDAIYLTYAQEEEKLQQVAAAHSFAKIKEFLNSEKERGERIVFIIDGVDNFDVTDSNENFVTGKTKVNLKEALYKIACQHIFIRSASANVQSLQHAQKEQTYIYGMEGGVFYFGGLSKIEASAWWRHAQDDGLLPDLLVIGGSKEEQVETRLRREEIEYLTGSNFFLLNVVLILNSIGNKEELADWILLKDLLVKQRPFLIVRQQVTVFYKAVTGPSSKLDKNV